MHYETKNIYGEAFKQQAVELFKERMCLSELARELGIRPHQLYNWRKEFQEFNEGSFLGNGNLKFKSEQKYIHELGKQLCDRKLIGWSLNKNLGTDQATLLR